MKRGMGGVLAVVSLMGCGGRADEPAPGARAELVGADGASHGTVVLIQQSEGVLVRAAATGLPVGLHGFHIHTVGKCDPPFESAGSHFNPLMKKHGTENPEGPHAGDLPNLTASANAPVILESVARGATLAALFDADSSALVIHANPDDYKTDPSGNSGARIACGVIRRP